jgi:hypothetical protein
VSTHANATCASGRRKFASTGACVLPPSTARNPLTSTSARPRKALRNATTRGMEAGSAQTYPDSPGTPPPARSTGHRSVPRGQAASAWISAPNAGSADLHRGQTSKVWRNERTTR